MDPFTGAILGKGFEELILNPVLNYRKQEDATKKILKRVKNILKKMGPIVNQIKDEDRRIDDRENSFIQLFEEGDNLIRKYYFSHWLHRDRKFAGKITDFYESLTDFFQVHLPMQQFNRGNENSAPPQQQQQQSDETEVSFSGDEIGNLGESEFTPFIVEMKRPLREVKKLLFEFKEEDDESSVIVVTAPGGCGKTTLAKQICQDPDVKGKFEDIFSFKVEHNLLPAVPDFATDGVSAIHRWLERRRKNRPQTASLLLVFDDVWGGPDHRDEPEFPLHKFVRFKTKCKILVTSRYEFPRIGSTYKLDLLDDEQSKKLLRHAGFIRDGDKDYDDVVDKLVKRCSGFPLALEVIGGSLRGQPVCVWKSRESELSEGESILDSGEGLLDCLQRSLVSLKAMLKECFMDLGSFPYQAKIPITALIDMWAELYQLDKNGVRAISNLCKLSLQNLLNLVVTRKGAVEDEAWYDDDAFVLQHDVLRDLAIRQSSQEPMEERTRLFVDLTGNKLFPEWRSKEVQPCTIKARLISISTDKMFSSSWCKHESA